MPTSTTLWQGRRDPVTGLRHCRSPVVQETRQGAPYVGRAKPRLLRGDRGFLRRGEAAGGVVGQDEVADPRQDLLAPAAAVEDAVVADALLEVVAPLFRGQTGDDLVGRPRLAGGGDVVQLA